MATTSNACQPSRRPIGSQYALTRFNVIWMT